MYNTRYVKYGCIFCKEDFQHLVDYYWSYDWQKWIPMDRVYIPICPKCEKARKIIEEIDNKKYIETRDKLIELIEMKGGIK